MKQIIDEFTDLPMHREQKRQLRKAKLGLCCFGGCDEKLFNKCHCLKHAVYHRERVRALNGHTRRNLRAASYKSQ